MTLGLRMRVNELEIVNMVGMRSIAVGTSAALRCRVASSI